MGAVRTVENLWLPGHGGVRLAARAWFPVDADARGVPAVVETVPYRKRDGTRARDEGMHRWFAERGLACLRIDVRGTGESDGLLLDEYTAEELADAVAAIEWIARQPWCNGAVGLIGKSWGGFHALQVAALAPPALRAVVSVCSTDDRFADDAHYMGGCLLTENLNWGAALFTLAAQPPDPRFVGAAWRARWEERLDALPLFAERWLRHPARDAYWRHGSVGEDYLAIRCPVLLAGGWADGYTNAVPRLLAGLRVPTRAIIGPWGHQYPHQGVPGPAIGFLQEALAWWRRWLSTETPRVAGARDESARVIAFVPDGPSALGAPLAPRRGRWIAADRWPPDGTEARVLHLGTKGLSDAPAQAAHVFALRSPATLGRAGGAWCRFGLPGDAPGDQRVDDEHSLVFDTPPLEVPLVLLGAPALELELASDRPHAQLVARLCDVAPDGTSERISFGVLNLAHRAGSSAPTPLVPGRPERVRLALNHGAHTFGAGRRLRLALSTAYWPMVWPLRETPTLSVATGAASDARLELPVLADGVTPAQAPSFADPEEASPPPMDDLEAESARLVHAEDAHGHLVRELHLDREGPDGVARTRYGDIDLVHGHASHERTAIHPDGPRTAEAEVEHWTLTARDDWDARVHTRTRLTADADGIRLEAELEAREGDRVVRRRAFDVRVPRP